MKTKTILIEVAAADHARLLKVLTYTLNTPSEWDSGLPNITVIASTEMTVKDLTGA